VLGSGASSRLYQRLVKEQRLFSNIECYHFGSFDPGLLTIEGKLVKGVKIQDAEAAVNAEIEKLVTEGIDEKELQKSKNKTESLIAFEDMALMSRATNLAMYELLKDASLMNEELQKFQAVTAEELKATAAAIFDPANSNTMYYLARN
jgi:predicted Zn-dependent peptidase